MTTPIERHLADFMLKHKGQQFLSYRRRCLEHWETAYGPTVVMRVKALLSKEYKGGAG